jgi:hypothetical protein
VGGHDRPTGLSDLGNFLLVPPHGVQQGADDLFVPVAACQERRTAGPGYGPAWPRTFFHGALDKPRGLPYSSSDGNRPHFPVGEQVPLVAGLAVPPGPTVEQSPVEPIDHPYICRVHGHAHDNGMPYFSSMSLYQPVLVT